MAIRRNQLKGVDPNRLANLLDAAADVTLVVSKQRKVTAASFAAADLEASLKDFLVGSRLVDTVTSESREKAVELLQPVPGGGTTVRDLVHRLPNGEDFPMRYGASAVFPDGRMVLLGRDLRAVTVLQQQVLDAQMALEQDYWQLRNVEARYHLLFEMATDALLLVDEATLRVLEANPLADRLLGVGQRSIVGKSFPASFDKAGSNKVTKLLREVVLAGRGNLLGVKSGNGGGVYDLSVTMLRQGDESRYLVRVSPAGEANTGNQASDAAVVADSIMHDAPDAIVLTDSEGRIRVANRTFLEAAQLASQEQVVGRSVDRWLGRTGVDLSVLLSNLREHGSVRLFATKLRSELGTTSDVEISASRYDESNGQGFAFFIRDVGRRLVSDRDTAARLPQPVEQITQQVGRVPLKDLVRQSTEVIELLCIEAALELTGGNRASAAELLGVSRQGLYAKLSRHNIGDKAAQD